jgi:hypothetical protein
MAQSMRKRRRSRFYPKSSRSRETSRISTVRSPFGKLRATSTALVELQPGIIGPYEERGLIEPVERHPNSGRGIRRW